MSRRVTAARDRCLELERVIAGRARSGSLGLDDALKLFDELLPIARPASVHAFNQLLTVVSRAKGRGSLTSALVVSLFNRMARASPTKICSAQVQHGWKACCCHSRNHGVDSMTDDARPAQEEATDVANAVLDGSDAILLGAETRDLHTVETISTVGKIVLRLRRYSTMICQQVYCETCGRTHDPVGVYCLSNSAFV